MIYTYKNFSSIESTIIAGGLLKIKLDRLLKIQSKLQISLCMGIFPGILSLTLFIVFEIYLLTMTQIPAQNSSMSGIYDHRRLCQHKVKQIPMNIILGQMINKLLNEADEKLLKKVCESLKKQYANQHNDILDTEEKKTHIMRAIEKIMTGKYSFVKQNIQEGEKFNKFYQEVQIPLPSLDRNFQCIYCKERSFKTNASLHSHYRSCPIKRQEQKQNEMGKREGFRPLRNQLNDQELRARQVNVQIITHSKEEQKVKKQETQNNFKRQRPVSTFSLGSDIFYEDA